MMRMVPVFLMSLLFSRLALPARAAESPPLLVASFCENVGGWNLDRDRILKRFTNLGYEIREIPCKRASLVALAIEPGRRGVFFYTGHGSAKSGAEFVFNAVDADVLGAELAPRIPRDFFIWIDACFSGSLARGFPSRAILHAASHESAAFSSPKMGGAMSTWVHTVLVSPRSQQMDLDRDGVVSVGELIREVQGDPAFFTRSVEFEKRFLGLSQSGAGLSAPEGVPVAIRSLPLGRVSE